jgi:hypothetical protein
MANKPSFRAKKSNAKKKRKAAAIKYPTSVDTGFNKSSWLNNLSI